MSCGGYSFLRNQHPVTVHAMASPGQAGFRAGGLHRRVSRLPVPPRFQFFLCREHLAAHAAVAAFRPSCLRAGRFHGFVGHNLMAKGRNDPRILLDLRLSRFIAEIPSAPGANPPGLAAVLCAGRVKRRVPGHAVAVRGLVSVRDAAGFAHRPVGTGRRAAAVLSFLRPGAASFIHACPEMAAVPVVVPCFSPGVPVMLQVGNVLFLRRERRIPEGRSIGGGSVRLAACWHLHGGSGLRRFRFRISAYTAGAGSRTGPLSAGVIPCIGGFPVEMRRLGVLLAASVPADMPVAVFILRPFLRPVVAGSVHSLQGRLADKSLLCKNSRVCPDPFLFALRIRGDRVRHGSRFLSFLAADRAFSIRGTRGKIAGPAVFRVAVGMRLGLDPVAYGALPLMAVRSVLLPSAPGMFPVHRPAAHGAGHPVDRIVHLRPFSKGMELMDGQTADAAGPHMVFLHVPVRIPVSPTVGFGLLRSAFTGPYMDLLVGRVPVLPGMGMRFIRCPCRGKRHRQAQGEEKTKQLFHPSLQPSRSRLVPGLNTLSTSFTG